MIHGEWVDFDITGTGKTSDECDLGRVYETAIILLPTINSGTIAVQGAKEKAGTFANLYTYSPATGLVVQMITEATTGGYFCIFPIGGYQYIKLVSSVNQTNETFYAIGVRS